MAIPGYLSVPETSPAIAAERAALVAALTDATLSAAQAEALVEVIVLATKAPHMMDKATAERVRESLSAMATVLQQ